MFQLIKNYVSKMKIEDVRKFALKNGIELSDSELDFVYRFVKKNYEALYANPNIDLSKYKNHFSEENYQKIMKLVTEYKAKYLGM
ncbi:MAG TPA: hypothetical protein DCY94_03020 [Firmicutes bacterium]|nr:hypothetical protein [Bacillota bacterium]